MMPRRRVLIIQPSFQGPGGGNAVAAWMLEALRGHHQVGALCWSDFDPGEMNRMHGTTLTRADVAVESVAASVRAVGDAVTLPVAALKYGILLRRAKQLASGYDLCVSACNEADFGGPGIQYVHYPFYQRPRPYEERRRIHLGPILSLYYWFADRLAGFSMARMRQNETLANSEWTRALIRRLHGIDARVLYPPVAVRFQDVPWSARRNGFLCIGRLSPEKHLDRVLDIVGGVRQHVPDVTLGLVGTPGPPQYMEHIRQRVRNAGGWVSLRENLSRNDLLALIPTYRFGIHGMPEEPFGMAPAEMAAAGCVVFVPNRGGQVEIVNRDPRLVYGTTAEAVERIVGVLQSLDAQHVIRNALLSHVQAFSVNQFIASFREIVHRALGVSEA
jgi:glycosyltransferase involved in cell wall biosynthesis